MSIQLSPQTQELIEELIASGDFANATAVVEAAISRLVEHEREIAWLKSELAVAKEQDERGELIDFTPEYAEGRIQEAIERYEARSRRTDAVGS